MEIVENKSLFSQLHKKVKQFQNKIKPLRQSNNELQLLVRKLKHLLGDDQLDFVEKAVQTTVIHV